MKIYLKSPEDNRIIEFQNENQIGAGFIDWKPATEQEINDYLLNKIKQEKLVELKRYCKSDECWTYQITDGKNSLTKTADWFALMLPSCFGKKIFLESDSGLIEYDLPRDVGENLLYQIKIISSLEIKKLHNELKVKIEESENKGELEELDIKSFLGKTPRVININKL